VNETSCCWTIVTHRNANGVLKTFQRPSTPINTRFLSFLTSTPAAGIQGMTASTIALTFLLLSHFSHVCEKCLLHPGCCTRCCSTVNAVAKQLCQQLQLCCRSDALVMLCITLHEMLSKALVLKPAAAATGMASDNSCAGQSSIVCCMSTSFADITNRQLNARQERATVSKARHKHSKSDQFDCNNRSIKNLCQPFTENHLFGCSLFSSYMNE
jgi:hypothetical protein